MKRTLLYIALGASLAFPSCHKGTAHASEEAPAIEVARPVVDSVTIHKSYPGRLEATDEVAIVARVNGYLRSMDYKGGAFVRKGDVLFRIEDGSYRDAVKQAQASLADAKASLEYASSRYAAMVEALKGDAVSEMEVAQAKSTLEQCRANVKTAEAALSSAESQLGYCTVRAPFDGHATTNVYSVGSYLAGEGAPVTLATLYADANMTAIFSVEDDATLGTLKKNIAAGTVDLSAIPLKFAEELPHSYTADLSYMAPQINTSTGTMTIQASVPNPYEELHAGMFVTVDLPVATDPSALLIADSAIGTDQLGKYVYVVNDSNRVVYTTVETGELVADTLRIITKGLTPSSRYVTKALLKVRSGMEVKPIE
ncbi:MAG: efflux RND transporter periplasmic adaptor subunit [Muribaculaceae bacterium]|nr:efflux RND transporter periplasmic adaptor subunit [Muribaculaceae bacterium]